MAGEAVALGLLLLPDARSHLPVFLLFFLGGAFVSLLAAGAVALFAAVAFRLPVLAAFAGCAGLATEFGRLSFQSLMQRFAPEGAHGRVFVRYDMAFQLAWVAGAFLAAVLPFSFRVGVMTMAAFYLTLGVFYLSRPIVLARLRERAGPG